MKHQKVRIVMIRTFSFCHFWLIGQNVLVKTATTVEISTVVAVISFLKEDTGWTKCVGKNRCTY
jgi:hypothetical protein